MLAAPNAPAAWAHDPAAESYKWTCAGGANNNAGNCYQHHSYADETWSHGASVPATWKAGIEHGAAQWDKTDGHQFDFVYKADGSGRSRTEVVNGPICGTSAAVGCTGTGVGSGNHTTACTIQFRGDLTWNLDPNATTFTGLDLAGVAAHEFGHCVGLGHSTNSFATMGGAEAENSTEARYLAYYDKKGRCQIYGHAHGYWGGCSSFGGTS